jgi:hypothetical protein
VVFDGKVAIVLGFSKKKRRLKVSSKTLAKNYAYQAIVSDTHFPKSSWFHEPSLEKIEWGRGCGKVAIWTDSTT